jgi:predicted DNA-binding transcriptional regulator AlpA
MKTYLTGPEVQARYTVTYQTIWRWLRNESLGFPKPIKFGGRYNRFSLDEIEAWERKQKTVHVPEAA